jgi:hypothetical protein
MAKTRKAYAPEFRQQMAELIQAGRSPEEPAKEFEPTAKSIREWAAPADCDFIVVSQRQECCGSGLTGPGPGPDAVLGCLLPAPDRALIAT